MIYQGFSGWAFKVTTFILYAGGRGRFHKQRRTQQWGHKDGDWSDVANKPGNDVATRNSDRGRILSWSFQQKHSLANPVTYAQLC